MIQSPGKEQMWLSTPAQGANWAARDADLLVMAPTGKMAVVGASRSSDSPPQWDDCIGVAGIVVNDKPVGKAWGVYSDLQHEQGAWSSFGIEVSAKNKGANLTATPYNHQTGGVFGAWLAGGGDVVYGGDPVNPSNAAVVILKNDHTWNRGIVVAADALTGAFGIALHMAQGHRILWDAPNGRGAEVRCDVADTANRVALILDDNKIYYVGANDKGIVSYSHVVNAVNCLAFFNAVTGSGPAVVASGDDADIDIRLAPKGAGKVQLGAFVPASGSTTITGYIEIKDSTGAVRKLAVVA